MKRMLYLLLALIILLPNCNTKPININKDLLKCDWISTGKGDLLFIEDSLMLQTIIETSDYVVNFKLSYDTLLIFAKNSEYFSDTTRPNITWKYRILSVDTMYLALERVFPVPDSDTLIFRRLDSVKKNKLSISDFEFSSGLCFGTCPVIDLKITSDSILYLYGYCFTKHKELFKYHLNTTEYNRIQRKLNSIHPDSIFLRPLGPDMQSYTLYIKSDKGSVEMYGNIGNGYDCLKYFVFYLMSLDQMKELIPVKDSIVTFRHSNNYNFLKKR
jgi:hypothetical protein